MKKLIVASFIIIVMGGFALAPQSVLGATSTDPKFTIKFTNPLEKDKVDDVAKGVLTTLQAIVAVLAVVFMVIGGILYITSAGDEKRMTTAKGAIIASMIGLAIAVAAPSLLREVYEIVGGTWNGPAAPKSLSDIVLKTLDLLLSLVGILAMIMLVVGGIMYITAAGDESRTDTAKKIVTYAIIGLIVAITSLIIVNAIAKLVIA